jgi:hypothetical protein
MADFARSGAGDLSLQLGQARHNDRRACNQLHVCATGRGKAPRNGDREVTIAKNTPARIAPWLE